MTIATVTTDINIGPFIIPSNGQNMIMNNYAERNKLAVEIVIPEPMKSNSLATLQWIHQNNKISKVILSSIHQLPRNKKIIDKLIKNMEDVEFHFALEGIKGKGKIFLTNTIKEASMFMKAKSINSNEKSWLDLYKLQTNQH